MARELDDWITSYLQYTENTEPPRSYHVWCGLAVIAGALQRKVWISWGLGQTIYPNLYVVLVGPSGRTRKGVAIGIAKDLLKQVPGVSVAPESSSGREALILAMRRAIVNFSDPVDGRIRFHCSLSAFSEELSVFLGQGDIKYLANLTDWYDSKDEWEYETIGRGKDSLQGLCFNMVGGTAPDWLQSMLPQEAVGGGFTARIIFIVEDRKGKIVPDHNRTESEEQLAGCLLRDLERVSQLSGPFEFDPSARQAYINWYIDQDTKLANGQPAVEDARFASYCERRATHLRKLMMLFSASRGDDLVISIEDFKRARETLEKAEVKMGRTFGGLGQARYSNITEKIIEYIRNMGITTRAVLMGRFYRDVDSGTLKQIEEQLQQMKLIEVKVIPDKNERVYTWIGDKHE